MEKMKNMKRVTKLNSIPHLLRVSLDKNEETEKKVTKLYTIPYTTT